MIKLVTFKCLKNETQHTFKIGPGELAMLQDVVDNMPERDADKLLEAVNRMLMNKSEAQRTAFMMNNVETFSMINYDLCGPYINLFGHEDVNEIFSKYNPAQLEKLNTSMSLWEDACKSEGFIAFHAIHYCRKCKKLMQGMYLKVRSIEDKKERIYLYSQKCSDCGGELALVNDANMGYLFDGLVLRAPCPDCGGKLVVSSVSFKPKDNSKEQKAPTSSTTALV